MKRIPSGEAGYSSHHVSVRRNEEGGGHDENAPEGIRDLAVRIQHHRIRNPGIFDVGRDACGIGIVKRDADNGETVESQVAPKRYQVGNFLPAGSAPRGPEVHQEHATPKVAHGKFLTAECRKRDVRRRI